VHSITGRSRDRKTGGEIVDVAVGSHSDRNGHWALDTYNVPKLLLDASLITTNNHSEDMPSR